MDCYAISRRFVSYDMNREALPSNSNGIQQSSEKAGLEFVANAISGQLLIIEGGN